MKIVYLNVWGADMLDALVPYLTEQARDTDVFCFQEATENMKARCAEALSDFVEFSDYKQISDQDDFPQSTFIKKGIEVISSGTLMPTEMDRGLAIYTEIKTSNGSLYICNVHGKARPGAKLDDPGRIMQSEDIVRFFKDKQNVIIGGDYNILPDTESMQMYAKNGYRDLIQEFAIDTTRNHYAWDKYPTKLYYSDYVFLKGDVTLNEFSVPKIEVSDHLPMIVQIDA